MRRLLIRPGAIGDCILCFPAMQHLAANYTEVWVPSAVVPLVQFADRVTSLSATGIDLVGVGDLAAPDDLKERLRSFDEVVSWYGANREEFQNAIRKLGVPCTFHRLASGNGFAACHGFFLRPGRRAAGSPSTNFRKTCLQTAHGRHTSLLREYTKKLAVDFLLRTGQQTSPDRRVDRRT